MTFGSRVANNPKFHATIISWRPTLRLIERNFQDALGRHTQSVAPENGPQELGRTIPSGPRGRLTNSPINGIA